jgi:hypothetical protein
MGQLFDDGLRPRYPPPRPRIAFLERGRISFLSTKQQGYCKPESARLQSPIHGPLLSLSPICVQLTNALHTAHCTLHASQADKSWITLLSVLALLYLETQPHPSARRSLLDYARLTLPCRRALAGMCKYRCKTRTNKTEEGK